MLYSEIVQLGDDKDAAMTRDELELLKRRCLPLNIHFNRWEAPSGETRYYINLYRRGRWEEETQCRTKLWFTDSDPGIRVDQRQYPLTRTWMPDVKRVQDELNKFFRELEDIRRVSPKI